MDVVMYKPNCLHCIHYGEFNLDVMNIICNRYNAVLESNRAENPACYLMFPCDECVEHNCDAYAKQDNIQSQIP